MGRTTAWILIAFFMTSGAQAEETTAQNEQERYDVGPLSSWLEREFEIVGKSCFDGFKRRNKNTSVVPRSIVEWIGEDDWSETVQVFRNASQDAVFTTVYERDENQSLKPVGLPIGSTWNAAGAPIVYRTNSNFRREHNCTTLLAGNAKARLDVGFAQLQAAIDASTNKTTSQSLFAYGGQMVSPITTAIQKSTITERVPNLSEFSVWLSLWQWLRANPSFIERVDRQELEIRNVVDGVAVARITGITVSDILKGNAGGSFSIPFFSASAEGEAAYNGRIDERTASYSVALRGGSTAQMAHFPKVSEITRRLESLGAGQFSQDRGNKTEISSSQTFEFAMLLADVPSNFCTPTFWDYTPEDGGQNDGGVASVVSISGMRVDPVLGENGAASRTCRFVFDVTPPNDPQENLSISIRVGSKLPLVTNGQEQPVAPDLTVGAAASEGSEVRSPHSFTLTARKQVLTDLRAGISLRAPSAPKIIRLTNDDNTSVLVEYKIQRKPNSAQSIGSISQLTSLTMDCGSGSVRSVEDNIVWSNTEGQGAKLSGEIFIPADILGADDAGSSCQLDGSVTLVLSDGLLELDFPTTIFEVQSQSEPEGRS